MKETLEGEMRFFPANAKSAIVLEPGDGAFDGPASFVASQGSAVLGLRAIEPVGRFDEKIVFKPLSPDTQREIGRLVISEELDRLRQQGFDLSMSDAAFEFLVRRGIHKALGARPMKKTVQKFIGDAISQALKSDASSGGTLVISPIADHLTIER